MHALTLLYMLVRICGRIFVKVFSSRLASLKYRLVMRQSLSQEAGHALPQAGTCFQCSRCVPPGVSLGHWMLYLEVQPEGFKLRFS